MGLQCFQERHDDLVPLLGERRLAAEFAGPPIPVPGVAFVTLD